MASPSFDAALARLLDRIESEQLKLHALLVLHRGELRVERYWPGHGGTDAHRLYSVAKSFTALAVGALCDDGLLRLEDLIVDHFPEKLPAQVHPWIAAMTVRDLLTMRTAHRTTSFTQVQDADWVRTFFTVPPTQQPGSEFSYDTSASVVLSALVEKLTGRWLEEYLLERVLAPIGFGDEVQGVQPALSAWRSPLGMSLQELDGHPSWEPVPTNPGGVTHGGSAMFCTVRDLARFAQLCLAGGLHQDRQIISAEFMAAATGWQTPTADDNFRCLDNRQGYGFQFWRTRHDGFLAWGIGGQIALCLPRYDFALVTLGSTFDRGDDHQILLDALWEEMLPALKPVAAPQTTLRLDHPDAPGRPIS